MRWLAIALTLICVGCSQTTRLLSSTSAGPKDIAGIEQYRLGMPLPSFPSLGFKETGAKNAVVAGRRTFVTAKLPQPGNPAVSRIVQLTYSKGQLAQIIVSFIGTKPVTAQALRNTLETDIKREYDPGLLLRTKTLQMNDAQGDHLAVMPIHDPATNPPEDMVTVCVSRPSLLY
jgi:hypothetical protein